MFELVVDERLIGRKEIAKMTQLGTLPEEFVTNFTPESKSLIETDFTVNPENKLLITLKHLLLVNL